MTINGLSLYKDMSCLYSMRVFGRCALTKVRYGSFTSRSACPIGCSQIVLMSVPLCARRENCDMY
jgi:hypothetical protein